MTRLGRTLRLYGSPSDRPGLPWSWVEEQLSLAMTYWVTATPADPVSAAPAARPVWGVWHHERLHVSIGGPVLRNAMARHPPVSVHLASGTDVVVVEGLTQPGGHTAAEIVDAYDRKYGWQYQTAELGELASIHPTKILAWRAAGDAGRDGFEATGCWVFDE
jgi:hypothetical protein